MPRLSTIERASLVVLLTASCGLVTAARQQPAAPERVAFLTATVTHTVATGGFGSQRTAPGGQYVATNMPLRNLIRLAYGNASLFRPKEQIVGGPDWIDTEKFDINAKAASDFVVDPDGVTRQHLAMLRTLLEDRFKLKAHMEQRDWPIYALVLARGDGAFGPKLADSTLDCSPDAPPRADGLKCGVTSGQGQGPIFRGMPMSGLVTFLNVSPAVDRLVRDMTGLTGRYDYQLTFTQPLLVGPGGLVPNPEADGGVSVFNAIQDQLGLKLEPRTAPVDVLVIDHIEKLGAGK
jgi:uncharacterized protein (TIGR03435 family)